MRRLTRILTVRGKPSPFPALDTPVPFRTTNSGLVQPRWKTIGIDEPCVKQPDLFEKPDSYTSETALKSSLTGSSFPSRSVYV
jgi:hypothetical protein